MPATAKHSKNPRFVLDEAGTWWYVMPPYGKRKHHHRRRAFVGQCAECGTNFVRDGRGTYCDRGCSRRATARTMSGENHPLWRGGRWVLPTGYVRVLLDKDPPFGEMRNTKGYVLEHRLVMATHLGRSLARDEVVHHINGDRADNRIENLQLLHAPHVRGRGYRCADCGSLKVIPAHISQERRNGDTPAEHLN